MMGFGANPGQLFLGIAVFLHALQGLDGIVIHEGTAVAPDGGLLVGNAQNFRFLMSPMLDVLVFTVLFTTGPECGQSHVRKGRLDLGVFIQIFQIRKHLLDADGQSHIRHAGQDMIHGLVQSRCCRSTGVFHIDDGHFLKLKAAEHHLAANTVLAGEHALNTIPVPDAPDGAFISIIAEACILHSFPDGPGAHGFIRSGHFTDRNHPYADDVHFFFHCSLLRNINRSLRAK